MNILHITPHLGGGLGKVILALAGNAKGENTITLMEAPRRGIPKPANVDIFTHGAESDTILAQIHQADIVVVHYYDHPTLAALLSKPIPDCRLVFWCHKRYHLGSWIPTYPDRFVVTSPVIGSHHQCVWSTGGVDRFLDIQPKKHEGFNIGYVGTVDYKKMHPEFQHMCDHLIESIPGIHFILVGEPHFSLRPASFFTFTGHVDDVAPYLAEFDVFGYPLRSDHYGTCEQVLGEAMASGVVPVVMDNPCERQIVKHGANGFVAITENDYVAHIQHLYTHHIRRQALAYNAREDAAELYSLDTMIARWNDVFSSMMQEPKKSRGVL